MSMNMSSKPVGGKLTQVWWYALLVLYVAALCLLIIFAMPQSFGDWPVLIADAWVVLSIYIIARHTVFKPRPRIEATGALPVANAAPAITAPDNALPPSEPEETIPDEANS